MGNGHPSVGARWPRIAAVALALCLMASSARADDRPPLDATVAVLDLEALGMDSERVSKLAALLRSEISRLTGKPVPTPDEIARSLKSKRLQRCAGETKCLSAIGKKLNVDLVVFGNVASLGDAYVMNIKVIDAAKGAEIRRVQSDPLRGNPDELIESVRIAAYRLLVPEELKGSVQILADVPGASVMIDNRPMGATPLPAPIRGLSVGPHRLSVTAPNYSPFEEEINVRFQKTTRVVVRLATGSDAPIDPLAGTATRGKQTPKKWYQKPWFYVAVGAVAVAAGASIGYFMARDKILDCPAECQ